MRDRNHALIVLLVLAVVAAPKPADAETEGPQAVGVGLPPDSVSVDRDTQYCVYTTTYKPGPGFRYWRHNEIPQINDDVELFVSMTLSGAWEVTDGEARDLVEALDYELDNAFDVGQKDIELITNYLSCTGEYDDGFEIFPDCSPEVDPGDRDHMDFYLVKLYSDATGGKYTSSFIDTVEDIPRDTLAPTYKYNAFHITDAHGNESGDPSWPQKAAVGAAHEFGHVLWASNTVALGSRSQHGDFDEFHAGVAAYVARTTWGSIGSADLPYAQSLLWLFYGGGPPCAHVDEGTVASCDTSFADLEDCMTGYRTRALFIAYLMQHFHDEDYEDDLLYQWARIRDGAEGPLIRDMCGLARVLDDDSLYVDLGGGLPWPGNYRVRQVFHNYSIAKWLDDSTKSPYYSFGEDFSPTENACLFKKNPDDTVGCWENAVPPQFTVGVEADSVWRHVPGNASDPDDEDCVRGWNDPTNDGYCHNDYCDPVVVRLWGSNYIALKADTTYYDAAKNDRYLQVKIDWEEGAMHDSTELWVSVVKYPSARDTIPLYNLGAEAVGAVATKEFGPGDDGVLINIPEFHEGGNEGAAIIMSLVATSHTHFEFDCGFTPVRKYCLPRYTEWPTDLEYSYSFAVLQEEQGGGGCPFVEIGDSGGFERDNNVLVGGVLGTDAVDAYRLERKPQLLDGEYRLRLTERQDDLSHFDRVALLAVEHPPGTEVCVLPGSEVRTYRVATLPSACRSEDEVDLLDLVDDADGGVATLAPGSWIEADFPLPSRGGGGIGTRGSPGQKIPPWGGRGRESDGSTVDLSALCYRANPWTNVIPMPGSVTPEGDHITLRFVAPTEFRIDQLFLADVDEADPATHECQLLSAVHSATGDCIETLAGDDEARTTLSRGDVIDLSFAARELDSGLVRDFVLITEGYYGPYEEHRSFEEAAPSALMVSDPRPNPFTGSTSIRFEIPDPGGRVSVRVYSVSGRLVRELGNGVLPGGTHEAVWDGKDDGGERVASGVYFYRIEGPGLQERRKMVLLH